MCWLDPVHQNLERVVTRLNDFKQATIWSLERYAVSVARINTNLDEWRLRGKESAELPWLVVGMGTNVRTLSYMRDQRRSSE